MAAQRVRAGDGPLERFRWWQLFTGHRLFTLQPGRPRCAVDGRLNGKEAGDDGMVHLYVDARHRAPVADARRRSVEVARSKARCPDAGRA